MLNLRKLRFAVGVASLLASIGLMGFHLPVARAQSNLPGGAPPTATPPPAAGAYVPALTFDVASIREVQEDEDSPSWEMHLTNPPHSSQFTGERVTAKALILLAYGIGSQLSGGPEWLNSRLFNVQAKCDRSVDDQLARLPDDQARLEKQHMLQALLAERFNLKVHSETQKAATYALVVAKNGPKLQAVKVEPSNPGQPDAPAPVKASDIQSHSSKQGHEIEAQHFSSKTIAGLLAALLRASVVDQTNLTGTYNFTLQYSNSPDNDTWPSIFTAVQEQLGLKLESAKLPVDTLVIDHMELPSRN